MQPSPDSNVNFLQRWRVIRIDEYFVRLVEVRKILSHLACSLPVTSGQRFHRRFIPLAAFLNLTARCQPQPFQLRYLSRMSILLARQQSCRWKHSAVSAKPFQQNFDKRAFAVPTCSDQKGKHLFANAASEYISNEPFQIRNG